MLDNNFNSGMNGTEPTPVQPQNTPATPVQPESQQAAQPQSSSYYSPRNEGGMNGGYIPPMGGNIPPRQGGNPEKPERPSTGRSHKGLRAMAMFAGIAFLSYASIQCYVFATQNESVRKFLGKDTSAAETRISLESDTPASTTEDVTSQQNTTTTLAEKTASATWISAAARENALSIPDIVEKVTPATVGIASTFIHQGQSYSMFGFGQPQTYEEELSATGTGIIMSKDGYIITNAHCIYDSSEKYHMGEAKEVQVVLNEECYTGETHLDAKIIAYDVQEDIAVLKVNTTQDLTVAEFGNSDDLRVGEMVVAIGNPLGFELFGSVTTGIISALNREITINDTPMQLIQTDTAINSGNSGGPLINSYGQVIGINSSKMSSNYYSNSASVEGLCFAIPMTHASAVINDLINYGYVTGKPLLGISGLTVPQEIADAYGISTGVRVQELEKGGAADLAGLQVGDIIIAINGETITDMEQLNSVKDQFKAGETITITVTRRGVDMDFALTLQEKKPSTN